MSRTNASAKAAEARLDRRKKPIPEPESQLIPLNWAKVPITKNQMRRTHYYAEAAIKKLAMAEARAAIVNARTKPMEQALVRLHYRPGTKRLCDADGLHPTLSICLDALVHEGILPDDNLLYVFEAAVRIWRPMPGIPCAFWLELEPIEEDEAA